MASRRQSLDDDGGLADLGRTFASLSRRLARQGRRVRRLALEADQVAKDRGIALHGRGKRRRASLDAIRDEVGYHAAWARWSETSDEMAALTEYIFRLPARTLGDLAAKFDVLVWLLLHDGAVVDTEAVRYVRGFGRELRRLTLYRSRATTKPGSNSRKETTR